MASTRVEVALDWTPNANHVGFYVAKAKGFYADAKLDVTLAIPDPEYSSTPVSKVSSDAAQFAVAPSETVVSNATQPPTFKKPRIQAVAALLQSDPSAIVTLASSGLSRPKDLDGKVYASYGARYEGRILQQLIRADGGVGAYDERALPMLGIWNTLLEGKADATWVFTNVEGVAAQRQGVDLNVFHLGDYGIPYGYSPVLVANESYLQAHPDTARAFLEATARGYEYAAAHAAEAAQLLTRTAAAEHPSLAEPLNADFVAASVADTVQYLLEGSKWGRMDAARWSGFLDWLSNQGLLTSKMPSRSAPAGDTASLDDLRAGEAGEPIPRGSISAERLFTNSFLPQ